MEDYRTEGRAVLLVGDLNLVADPVKDMHPGLRCAWDEREVEWFARVLGPYLDAYRHLHPHKTDTYTCFDQMKDNRGRNWGSR